jgi:hypothetical protein
MIVEKLTEDETACLQFDAGVNGEKALRIIKQLTDELQRRDEGEPLHVAIVERLRRKERELLELKEDCTRYQALEFDKGCKLTDSSARIQKAMHWLVTVKSDQPAGIIAHRARLALEALRGK